jgi:hypothetical protein
VSPTKRLFHVAVWLLLSLSTAFAQKSDFALRTGDRVVFFGDSITQQRLYTSYVQQFVLSRYPERRIVFINSGWGGDTVSANPSGSEEKEKEEMAKKEKEEKEKK